MVCPSEEELAGYLLGDGEPASRAALEAHLRACATCRAWIAEAGENDALLPDVQRVMKDSAGASEAVTVATLSGSSAHASLSALVTGTAGTEFAEYEILGELGRGGMGAVYLALQKSTKRKVALKVLLEGPFASESAKRRFEREVELAAQLQHPHIVTILESGIASGRYYFAMQFVEGRRLDQYVAEQRLSIRDRLALMATIAEAVNYAHQRGVIHRDLKPSNILVSPAGEPYILDFGLAKVAESSDESLALSVTGQIIGTLPYMSPEQAEGLHNDLDIRTDIYSLGVILYELLTGRFPYTVTGRIPDILRNIMEVEPRKPSSLVRGLDDDIDTIVLKALAKPRERRYGSAENFARDIRHYLRGDPIEARRDSTAYVLRKLLARYRVPVTAGAIVSMLLIGLLMWGSSALAQARESRLQREARDLLAQARYAPREALLRFEAAGDGLRRQVSTLAAEYVRSHADTQRIEGARLGYLAAPEAFWASVDGGPLWQSGEWLELALVDWPEGTRPIEALREKLRSGSPRQQYASLVLLGWMSPDAQLADLAAHLATTATEPGVVAAAAWAADRAGRKIRPPEREWWIDDPASGLTFVRVPGAEAFRRGAAPDDPDAMDAEGRVPVGVRIEPMYVSTTEVTLDLVHAFFSDPTAVDAFGPLAGGEQGYRGIAQQMAEAGDQPHAFAGSCLSLPGARRFCEWLTRRAQDLSPPRRYRLLTEDEWEWACRGGNEGRYCYGDDARYLRYFAKCDGAGFDARVARYAPNWYGLFDMHGNLWELCDTPFEPTGEWLLRLDPTRDWHVVRGGAFFAPAVRCRSSQRNAAEPRVEAESMYNGFRIVMEFLP